MRPKCYQRCSLNIGHAYKARGCDACHQRGYKGRIGIFELFCMNDKIRDLLLHTPSLTAVYEQAVQCGMEPLRVDAERKIIDGIISLEECARVLL